MPLPKPSAYGTSGTVETATIDHSSALVKSLKRQLASMKRYDNIDFEQIKLASKKLKLALERNKKDPAGDQFLSQFGHRMVKPKGRFMWRVSLSEGRS